MFGADGMAADRGGVGGVGGVRAQLGVGVGVLLACVVGTMVFAGVASARWSVQPTPRLEQGDALSGISCTSSTACVAVGGPDFGVFGGGVTRGQLFADRWDGRVWSLERLPTPAPTSSNLAGVSCPARNTCFAVGSARNQVLVESWNGTHWSVQRAPIPKAAGSGLLSVSCPSSNDCFAVGEEGASGPFLPGEVGYPLVERWNGSRWSIQPTAEPYGSKLGVIFSGVSCTSSTACTAVGYDAVPAMVAERWDGRRWSVQKINPSLAAYTLMAGVSCASHMACVAVGSEDTFEVSGDGDNPTGGEVAAFWNGERWGDLYQKIPANVSDISDLSGVSCVSAKACLAVGTGVERWNGTRWSNVPSAFLSHANPFLSVSCTSRTSCELVGSVTGRNAGNEFPFAARWSS